MDDYLKNAKLLVIVFVSMLVGAVLISSIASQVNGVTKLASYSESFTINRQSAGNVVNETATGNDHTISEGVPTGTWRADDRTCLETSSMDIKLANGTQLTLDTHYNYYPLTGNITFLNAGLLLNSSGAGSNSSVATYRYCDDDYLSSTWGRTAANLVPGFYALGILAIGIFLVYYLLREEGLEGL